MNAFPFIRGGSTLLLSALHLPIALWLVVGIAYVGGRWFHGGGRMDFVRFSGELFIYEAPPNLFDGLQLLLIASTLAADAVAPASVCGLQESRSPSGRSAWCVVRSARTESAARLRTRPCPAGRCR